MFAFFTGAGLGASLIIAIGAQNAFLLGQAIRKNYSYTIATVCALVDAVLVVLGVWGLGSLIQANPVLLSLITLGGAMFLFTYGLLAFRRALNPGSLKQHHHPHFTSRGPAVATTLALSLLNPHVYLDTVVLLGSIGGRLPGDEANWFAAGAICASFLWFFTLAFGGQMLAPVLNSPKHWQRLDCLIGVIMWIIALGLLRAYFGGH